MMQRRQAIRNMALLAGGMLALPDWARSWSPEHLPKMNLFLPAPDRQLLSAVIGAILPESDIPGAVSLGVPAFVELMLADCFSKEEADNVQTGLRFTQSIANRSFQKPFSSLFLKEQQDILTGIEQGDDQAMRDFYSAVKNLTIQGYTSSEYVQTNFMNYEMAPGLYRCVPVNQ